MTEWTSQWNARIWREILGEGVDDAALAERIRQATRTGRPFGDDGFVIHLESRTRRLLRPRKRGPKPAAPSAAAQLEFEVS